MKKKPHSKGLRNVVVVNLCPESVNDSLKLAIETWGENIRQAWREKSLVLYFSVRKPWAYSCVDKGGLSRVSETRKKNEDVSPRICNGRERNKDINPY